MSLLHYTVSTDYNGELLKTAEECAVCADAVVSIQRDPAYGYFFITEGDRVPLMSRKSDVVRALLDQNDDLKKRLVEVNLGIWSEWFDPCQFEGLFWCVDGKPIELKMRGSKNVALSWAFLGANEQTIAGAAETFLDAMSTKTNMAAFIDLGEKHPQWFVYPTHKVHGIVDCCDGASRGSSLYYVANSFFKMEPYWVGSPFRRCDNEKEKKAMLRAGLRLIEINSRVQAYVNPRLVEWPIIRENRLIIPFGMERKPIVLSVREGVNPQEMKAALEACYALRKERDVAAPTPQQPNRVRGAALGLRQDRAGF